MKKNEIKGLSAFEMLDGLDDDMILSASLPEAVPASLPTKGEKIAAFFARMGRGGMAAAIVAVVVVLGVLGGVLVKNLTGSDDPTVTQPSHGVQGTSAPQATDAPDTGESPTEDGSGSAVLPPLTESPDNTPKSGVSVVSDGITVYPRKYDIAGNCYEITDEGEQLVWSEGGGLYPMEEIYESLPVLMTAGNAFSQTAPEEYNMGRVRVFDSQFQKLSEPTTIEALSQLENGTYYVEQTASIKRWNSETEYVVETLQYAFCLIVDPNMDTAYPLRLLVDGKTYYLQGSDGINSGHALTELAPSIPTATITRDVTMWDFYLAPVGTLQSVTAYDGNFRLMMTEPDIEPLVSLHAWETGDYYFVFTATFSHEGESLTLEYPIHIRLVEEIEEETTPAGDVGETPDEPTDPLDRVLSKAEPMTPQTPDGTPLPDGSVLVGQTALYMPCFENGSSLGKRVSRMAVYRDGKNPYIHHLYADVLTDDGHIMMSETQEIHGYFALLEYDSIVVLATMEGDPSADGTSCTLYSTMETWLSWTDADNMTAEDLGDIRLQRVEYDHWVQQAPVDKLEKTYVKTVGRKWDQLSAVLRANGGAESFGVLVDFWTNTQSPRVYRHADSTSAEALEARDLILNVSQPYFDPVWETFVARLRDRIAGRDPVLPPASAENAVLVVMSGSGQSAVFNSTEEGFVAWREVDLSHIEGTRAADMIFTDDDAMRALPKMEIFYGDTLTLYQDRAGDDLIMVYLYDAKGGFITSGADLSVVNKLQNEGWDRHVIVILETVAVVSETERVCYEYAFELDIVQP